MTNAGSDENMQRLIRERARALWQADGCPEGHALDYWLRAEQEIMNQSIAGEEDPLAGLDEEEPGTFGPLRTGMPDT